jgi:hypothetical protein
VATREVLREFLVKIGWESDANQRKKFLDDLTTATRRILGTGLALRALADSLKIATYMMARSGETLFWMSQRTSTSVGSIRSFGYAMSQMGSSVESAQSALESIGRFQRSSPGANDWLKMLLGRDADLSSAGKIMEQLSKRFRNMPFYEARAFAEVLGIDDNTLMAIIRGVDRFEESYRAMLRRTGFDADQAAKASQEFMFRWREFFAAVTIVWEKALVEVMPSITEGLRNATQYVVDNMPAIARVVEIILRDLVAIGEWVGRLLMQTIEDFDEIRPQIAEFLSGIRDVVVSLSKGVEELSGWKTAFQVLLAYVAVTWVAGMLASIGRVAAAIASVAVGMGAGAAGLGIGGLRALFAASGLATAAAILATPSSVGDATVHAGRVSETGDYGSRSAEVVQNLMNDLGLTSDQAAAVVGHLGHESAGLQAINERNPIVPGSRGGFGWAQWTGPRREAFERFARERGMQVTDPNANYQFLLHELRTSHAGDLARLRNAGDRDQALQAFAPYLSGNDPRWVPAWDSRARYAAVAQGEHAVRHRGARLGPQPSPPAPAGQPGGPRIQQNVTVNVNEANDPERTRRAVEEALRNQNEMMLRSLHGRIE